GSPRFSATKDVIRVSREICAVLAGGCCAYGNMSLRQSTRNDYPAALDRHCSNQLLLAAFGTCAEDSKPTSFCFMTRPRRSGGKMQGARVLILNGEHKGEEGIWLGES